MNNSFLNRLTLLGCFVLLVTLALGGSVAAQDGESGNVKTSFRSVSVVMGGPVIPAAGTSLSRNNEGVFFTLHTQGLPAGHAVTAWMAVFNNPKYCATSPCTPADFANPDVDGSLLNTGGRVIGPDGAATYGAYRAVGDATGWNPGSGTGNGLVDPLGAEIHVVLRSHGPASADPAVLAQQLSMFNGGCPGGVGCANLQASVFQR